MKAQSKDTRHNTIGLSDIAGIAQTIARQIRGGEIFALIGPLGSGKTTFTQALAKHLGIKKRLTSPTFTLINHYTIPKNENNPTLHFYHADIYRTKNFTEIKQAGLPEVWGRKDSVICIEWANLIKKHLPKHTQFIYFKNEQAPPI